MSEHPISVYKQLIHSMVEDLTNERFIHQIYSLIYRQQKREWENGVCVKAD